MEDSSIPDENQDNNGKYKQSRENIVAWRIQTNLMPMFKDLAQQAYEAHLIKSPKLVNLARFSLSFFAEMWLQQKAAQARYEQEQLQGQRSPVKDIGQGNMYTGPGSFKQG